MAHEGQVPERMENMNDCQVGEGQANEGVRCKVGQRMGSDEIVSKGRVKTNVQKRVHVNEGGKNGFVLVGDRKCKKRSHKGEGVCTNGDDSKESGKHGT